MNFEEYKRIAKSVDNKIKLLHKDISKVAQDNNNMISGKLILPLIQKQFTKDELAVIVHKNVMEALFPQPNHMINDLAFQ